MIAQVDSIIKHDHWEMRKFRIATINFFIKNITIYFFSKKSGDFVTKITNRNLEER